MKTIGAADPNHPSAWFDREMEMNLWMPSSTMLNALSKPRDRSPAQLDVVMAPLLTSWFGVHHYEDATRSPWRGRDPRLAAEVARHSWKRSAQNESNLPPDKIVNSCLKVRLYPDQRQREKLDLMFATNRAIYNKLVGSSRDDCRYRLVLRGRKNDNEKMSVAELGSKYRPIAQLKTMAGYFRNNKKALARRMQAVTSSLALYYALKRKGKATTFPALHFRSKFAASNTINLSGSAGTEAARSLPSYLLRVWEERRNPDSVRNFVTIYDPDGRTFYVKDDLDVLVKRFKRVDAIKAHLSILVESSGEKYAHQVKKKTKLAHRSKRKRGRVRYRLRRKIRFTNRRVTRMVQDMHHKIASWLASQYEQVLLPSFHTSQMARKFERSDAADATDATRTHRARRKVSSPIVRAMMALSHYKFKVLLKCKMERAGGRLIERGEEYISKTCSRCGRVKYDLGRYETFKCRSCSFTHDRDVNAAKNIFIKNSSLSPIPTNPATAMNASRLAPMPSTTTMVMGKRSMQVVPKRSVTGQLLLLVKQDMHPFLCYFLDRDVELKFQTYYRHEKQRHVAVHMVCLVALATVFCVHGAVQRVTDATEHYLTMVHSISGDNAAIVAPNTTVNWFDISIFMFITVILYVAAIGCTIHLWRRRGETQFVSWWWLEPVELLLVFYCHLVFIPVTLILIACIDEQLSFMAQVTLTSRAEDEVLIRLLSGSFADALFFFLLITIAIAACLLRLQFPYFCLLSCEFVALMLVVSAEYYYTVAMRWSIFGVFVMLIAMLIRGVWENELSCRSEFLSSANLVNENRRLSNQNVEMKEELSGKLNYQLHYEMGGILRILCQIKIKIKMNGDERKDIDKIITALVTNEDLFEVSLDPSMAEYEDEVQGWLHMMAFKEPPPGLYQASSRLFTDRRVRKSSVPGQILQAANSRRMSHTVDAVEEERYSSDLISKFFTGSDLSEDSEDLSRWLVNTLRDQFFVDMFYIEQRCASPLQVVFLTCVEMNSLGSRLALDMKKLAGFIAAVENHYFKRNAYHNCLHAGSVVADMNFYLRRLNLDVDDRTFFVGLVAAAAHDISHPGVSNGFLIATRSKLAITYSDDSVLERMHIAELYRILSHDKFDIFAHMTLNVRVEVRKLIIQMVLATDLSRHFPHISKLKSKKFAVSEETRGLEVTLIMETLLMLSDLGHTAKPFPYHQVWANRISEEFFRQGEAEERHNLPISPLCDRRLANLPKSQITFLTLLATPLFETADQAFAIDEYNTVIKELHGNIRTWQSMIGRSESAHETLSNHSGKAPKDRDLVRPATVANPETQELDL